MSRVILSDGTNYLQSMLATQLNHLVEEKQMDKHTVLKLTGFSMNYVQQRRSVKIRLSTQFFWGEQIS